MYTLRHFRSWSAAWFNAPVISHNYLQPLSSSNKNKESLQLVHTADTDKTRQSCRYCRCRSYIKFQKVFITQVYIADFISEQDGLDYVSLHVGLNGARLQTYPRKGWNVYKVLLTVGTHFVGLPTVPYFPGRPVQGLPQGGIGCSLHPI